MAKTRRAGPVITAELFDEEQIVEVFDPEDSKRRYCLCRNPQTAGREGTTRERLLERTRAEPTRIAELSCTFSVCTEFSDWVLDPRQI
jgi:hypothetical protein